MDLKGRILEISYPWLCEIKLINFNSCVSLTALLSFFQLSACLQT
jgi:hypothetical protein